MGIITVEKVDHLIWLGRYLERVHTTIQRYLQGYDQMLDDDEAFYKTVCQQLGIPDIYGNRQAFLEAFPFDEGDPCSIISELLKAYDNAITLRDVIGSSTLSYVELALYDMRRAAKGKNVLMHFQYMLDHILAFWGCVEDNIDDSKIRNILKSGKGIERCDLYLRLNEPADRIFRELNKLEGRLKRSGLVYNQAVLETMLAFTDTSPFKYENVRNLLSKLVDTEGL